MRLADFIREHTEEIIVEWEEFARSTPSGEQMDKLALRNDVHDILMATAEDMESSQSSEEQEEKSKGESDSGSQGREIREASTRHGNERLMSGFEMVELVSEYRALRASILRLWEKSKATFSEHERHEITRFNESIDQSLAVSVKSYTEQVERSHQIFLAILAHDLRNPLNSVRSGVNLLTRKVRDDEVLGTVLSRMSLSISAMNHLIADLIDFARTAVGTGIPLSKAEIDLSQICQEVVDEMKTGYPEAQLEYHSDGTFEGNWDRQRIRQVLSNLLGNAVEHGAAGEPITLTIEGEGSDVLFRIHNRGAISKKEIGALFKPLLVRIKETETNGQKRHAGLGLYIAKEIVTGHGGTIEVESSAETGTTFMVTLPKDHDFAN